MRGLYVATPLVLLFACGKFGSDASDSPLDPDSDAGAHPTTHDGSTTSDGSVPGETSDGSSSAEQYASAVLADTPIAYWRCRDATPGSIHGEVGGVDATLGKAGPTQGHGGLFEGGGQCDFDGSFAQYATANGVPFLANSDYTLEAWLKPKDVAPSDYRHLFEHTNPAQQGDAYGVFLHQDLDTGNGLFVEEFTAEPQAHRVLGVPMPKDGWHHVVAVKGPKLYLDGKAAGNFTNEEGDVSFTRPFLFGSKGPDNDRAIVAAMTEIAVYSKALSPERIAVHYALGKQ